MPCFNNEYIKLPPQFCFNYFNIGANGSSNAGDKHSLISKKLFMKSTNAFFHPGDTKKKRETAANDTEFSVPTILVMSPFLFSQLAHKHQVYNIKLKLIWLRIWDELWTTTSLCCAKEEAWWKFVVRGSKMVQTFTTTAMSRFYWMSCS